MQKENLDHNPGQEPQPVKLDLSHADTMKCEDCGNYVWINLQL